MYVLGIEEHFKLTSFFFLSYIMANMPLLSLVRFPRVLGSGSMILFHVTF